MMIHLVNSTDNFFKRGRIIASSLDNKITVETSIILSIEVEDEDIIKFKKYWKSAINDICSKDNQ